jgi:hypothetical protein
MYYVMFAYCKFPKVIYVKLVAFQDGIGNMPLSRAFVYEHVGSLNMEGVNEYCEGCGLEGPIRCIFLCEFHPTAGPKITCQVCEVCISSFFLESENLNMLGIVITHHLYFQVAYRKNIH